MAICLRMRVKVIMLPMRILVMIIRVTVLQMEMALRMVCHWILIVVHH